MQSIEINHVKYVIVLKESKGSNSTTEKKLFRNGKNTYSWLCNLVVLNWDVTARSESLANKLDIQVKVS